MHTGREIIHHAEGEYLGDETLGRLPAPLALATQQISSVLQNLQSMGINAQNLSFSRKQQISIFKTFRSLVYDGLWNGLNGPNVPKMPTGRGQDLARFMAGKATQQMKLLRRKGETVYIDNGWKDLADARAASAWNACRLASTMSAATGGFAGSIVSHHQIMNGMINPQTQPTGYLQPHTQPLASSQPLQGIASTLPPAGPQGIPQSPTAPACPCKTPYR